MVTETFGLKEITIIIPCDHTYIYVYVYVHTCTYELAQFEFHLTKQWLSTPEHRVRDLLLSPTV